MEWRQQERHTRPPVSFRPPAGLEQWLRDYAAATGQTVGAVIVTALTEFRERREDQDPKR